MFKDDYVWRELQNYLPDDFQIRPEQQPNEKWLTFNDISIRYDEYLPKGKLPETTVLIFHGVGGNGRLLSFIAIPLVKAGYRVICPDFPGYGYTKFKDRFDYSTWISCGRFIASQKEFSQGNLFLIGLSAGGMLAYNVASELKKLNGLILTNILDNRIKEVRDFSAKNKFQSRIGIPVLKKMPRIITNMKIPVRLVTNMKAIVNDKRVLRLLLKDKVGSGSCVSLGFLLSMMQNSPMKEPEEFDNCPVLLAHPGNDLWTPLHLSRYFFDRFNGNKKLVVLDNAGHFPLEKPGIEQLREEAIRFIEENGY